MKPKYKNGDKVKDSISGLEGIITCVAIYLNGCIRYNVQPVLDPNGHYRESEMLDEQQLTIIKPVKIKKTKPLGGDRPALPKFKV